jgi:hypothetical protein
MVCGITCCREFALVTSLLQIKFSEDPTADEAVGGRRGRRERNSGKRAFEVWFLAGEVT